MMAKAPGLTLPISTVSKQMKLRSCRGLALSSLMAFLAIVMPALGQDLGAFVTPEAAKADPDFSLQGEYAASGSGMQLAALGDEAFLMARFPGGLPRAGWNGKERQESDDD